MCLGYCLSSFICGDYYRHLLCNYRVKKCKSKKIQFLTDLPCFGEGSAAGISCHGGLQY